MKEGISCSGLIKREKRQHYRFRWNLPLEYSWGNSKVIHAGYTVNASIGGLMGMFPENLKVGNVLNIKIFFSFGPEVNTIPVLARVIWVSRVKKKNVFQTGVKFILN